MRKCAGCEKEAKYIVYDQPHCKKHMLEAIENKSLVEVRWLEDATSNTQEGQ